MSDTDGGAPNRPGSAPGSPSGDSGSGPSGSGSSGSSGSGSAGTTTWSDPTSSGSETRPLPASGSSGSGDSGGAPKTAQKTEARPVPAKPGSGKPGAPVKQGPGGKPAARPVKAGQPRPRPAAPVGRRVRLTVSRIDPWSTMKLSFLLSVALGIALVVMAFVLWTVLNGMGVFDQINNIAANLFPVDDGEPFDLMDYIGLGKVMSLAIVVGVIDVILITAIATLSAFLYNLSSSLVGGLQLTLTDD